MRPATGAGRRSRTSGFGRARRGSRRSIARAADPGAGSACAAAFAPATRETLASDGGAGAGRLAASTGGAGAALGNGAAGLRHIARPPLTTTSAGSIVAAPRDQRGRRITARSHRGLPTVFRFGAPRLDNKSSAGATLLAAGGDVERADADSCSEGNTASQSRSCCIRGGTDLRVPRGPFGLSCFCTRWANTSARDIPVVRAPFACADQPLNATHGIGRWDAGGMV